MLQQWAGILDSDDIEKVFDLYKNTTNSVLLDGKETDRHWSSKVGSFIISEFTAEEFNFVWKKVKKVLPHNTELVYSRVLKYNTNSFIPKHLDTYASDWQQQNDLSIIIQLSHPSDYTGGEAIVSKRLFELYPGDCIYYTYEHEHEIKKVKSGIRYVVNLRCKLVK